MWIPKIVALSNLSDRMRLDRVREPYRHQMRIIRTRATLNVHYVKCALPLTLEDQTANVGGTTLVEDRELRALPHYTKRGTWYKIMPR